MERVQQAQQQHPDMQQRYFNVQLSEERKLLKETVKNTEEAEKSRIKSKEEEEKRQKKAKAEENRPEKMGTKHEKGASDEVEQGALIDIKV
ncbi:MAG: hypothetical protein HGA41_09235 [Syntrophaceae bacterium]|nr:hypothetical protein [Syntrophaceae bacterium]